MSDAEQWANSLGVSIDADAPTICRAFESLAVRLCPAEFGPPAGLPVYAVCNSMLPPDFTAASRHSNGWHSWLLHRWLHTAGVIQWRGDGPAILARDIPHSPAEIEALRGQVAVALEARGRVCDSVTIDDVFAVLAAERRDIAQICSTLLHELGHAVQSVNANLYFGLASVGLELEGDTSIDDEFSSLVASKAAEVEPGPPQLHAHDLSYTRIVAHLVHRLGFVPEGIQQSVAGDRFGQAPLSECLAALAREPARMAGRPFRRIIKTQVPPAFAACQRQSAAA